MGALFFCPYTISGAISDSVLHNDTITNTLADSIRAKKMALIRQDTIKEAIQDTNRKEIVKLEDTISSPSEKERNRMFADHSPHKATIYSAVLPGLGQAYNRKYWKIPIIYSAGLALYYGFGWLGFEDWGLKYYHEQYLYWKELYQTEFYKPPEEKNKAEEDRYSKNVSIARKGRDRIVIIMGILYVANIVDAMADAHFYYFDISDDLSMKILPSISTPDPYVAYNDYSLGVKLRFKF
jgi:hypothetical protein